MSGWDALMKDSHGCTMVQAGWDANYGSSSGPFVWYEVLCGGYALPMCTLSGQGQYPISPGNNLLIFINENNPKSYTVDIFDQSTSQSYCTNVNTGNDPFTPYYFGSIAETPQFTTMTYSDIAQSPKFSNFQVNNLCFRSDGKFLTGGSAWSSSHYHYSYLQQSSEGQNWGNVFVPTNNGYYNMNWDTSSYSVQYMRQNYSQDEPPVHSGGCVLNGTLISTSMGHTVAVQDLQLGDKILSYNPLINKFIRDLVTNIKVSNVHTILNINNGMLYVSGLLDQPIYVKLWNGVDEWIMIGNLTTSDHILNPITSKWIPVNSIQTLKGNFTVFEITGSYQFYQDGHTRCDYIANGSLLDMKIG